MVDTADGMLEELHADLKLLKSAIDAEDHSGAEQILAAHDLRLRGYIQAHGAAGSTEPLNSLLQQQKTLSSLMRELREQAGIQLRVDRQTTRAASAYQQAGRLA